MDGSFGLLLLANQYMKTNALFLATLSAAALLGGCKGEPADNSATIEFSMVSGGKLFVLEDSAREFYRDNDVTFRDSAYIFLPEIIFGKDVEVLRKQILFDAFVDSVSSPHDAMANYFFSSADDLGYTIVEADSTAVEDDGSGYCLVQGDILNITPRMLTYKVSTYLYNPGAAHGMENCTYITYNIEEGCIMTLADLFTPEGLEALPQLISMRAKKLERQLGETNIDALPAGGDFFINLNEEIVFVYQPYEVASYAQGMIHVPFYPYELTEYLTPQGARFLRLS